MPPTNNSTADDTQRLIDRARGGDRAAIDQLMARHRVRLRRMVAVRMDRRLAARVDPSDVVQEILAAAITRLPQYLAERPVAFYPWLRQIAWDRLIDLHRTHLERRKRSIQREAAQEPALSDESVMGLASQLMGTGTSPSAQVIRQELHQRVREALASLETRDREVLVMRHLEQMSISEIAQVLEISEGAVKMRRLRAIQRLRDMLEDDPGGSMP